MRLFLSCLMLITWGYSGLAQQALPVSDLFLLDIKADSLISCRKLNPDDSLRYRNQPYFDGSLLYCAQETEPGNTNIYAYDTDSLRWTQITNTPEPEFSPAVTPDGKSVSFVRIEYDGITQRLWKTDKKGNGPLEMLMPTITGIGYYAWLSKYSIALFIVDKPNRLIVYNTATGQQSAVTDNIGRCFQVTERNELCFIHNTTEDEIYIKVYDPKKKKTSRIIEIQGGSEDFAWTADNALVMGNGSSLYRFRPGKDKNWVEWIDLDAFGVNRISRIAISKNGKIAVVSTHE